MKLYSTDHEWIELVDGVATVGITVYAQEQLGDIVYIDMPAVGRAVTEGETVAEVESTKSVSDIYSPVAGEIVEVNAAASVDPAQVNADPEGAAWLFRVGGVDESALANLMSKADYDVYVNG